MAKQARQASRYRSIGERLKKAETTSKKLIKKINTAFGRMNFSWVKTKSHMQALIFEKKWIRLFKPECNEIIFKTTN